MNDAVLTTERDGAYADLYRKQTHPGRGAKVTAGNGAERLLIVPGGR